MEPWAALCVNVGFMTPRDFLSLTLAERAALVQAVNDRNEEESNRST